jgi:hypothetical protein
MRMIRIAALVAPLLLVGPTIAVARSTFAQATLEKYFKLDWQVVRSPRGPVIEGYVYSLGPAAERMRLSIELLDGAGNVAGDTTTWVLGGVPGHSRAWFSTRVPESASYRVEILSFDWASRGQ